MSFADIPEETVERFRETFQQSKQLMTYYSCALLEVETKFRVLNQQFSLEQEHNPIETIKTRLKSMESIMDKLYRKKLPFEVSAVEECLTDVAGIRVICPFIEDIYRLPLSLGLYQESQGQWLPKSSSDRGNSHFSAE